MMIRVKNIRQMVLACGTLLALAGTPIHAGETTAPHRIVSADGVTTETLFALGAGHLIVARDSGSTYPPEATELPDIGMGHQLNPEAILSHRPTVVIGRDRPMSQPAFHVLESTGLPVLRLASDPGIETARENIRKLATYTGTQERGNALIAALDRDLQSLAEKQAARRPEDAPPILVVYLRPNATLLMGEDSNAVALARLAGARSAIPGIEGYKPLNAEAVVAAAPEILLCYKDGLDSVGGLDALYGQPGISETPAARNQRVIAMDDLLLGGFGPRTGEALLELHHALFETTGPYIDRPDSKP